MLTHFFFKVFVFKMEYMVNVVLFNGD